MRRMGRGEVTGAAILRLIRDQGINDARTLADKSEIATTFRYIEFHDRLDLLRQLGLITFEGSASYATDIKITSKLELMQKAMGISLRELEHMEEDNSIIVEPYFGKPYAPSYIFDLFVVMPFQQELRPIYDDHISSVAKSLSLTVHRADDFFTASFVMSDVWSAICNSRAIIADCTGRNPNVFYELGLSHTIGKPVILITQNSEDVPFDIRHIRYIKYDYTPRGMKIFEETLSKTIKYELGLR